MRTHEIPLQCGGTVRISIEASPFDWTEADRAYIFALADYIKGAAWMLEKSALMPTLPTPLVEMD